MLPATPIDPRDFCPTDLDVCTLALGLPPERLRQWMTLVIGEGVNCPDQWNARGLFPKRFSPYVDKLPQLQLEKVVTSERDGFQKILFRTHDNLAVEAVAIPLHKPNCVCICLSSQVGCVMGCSFCATAKMKQRRNLATWEILDQFIQTRMLVRRSNRRVTGAVFMGMGEPFLNYDRVLAAAELLRFPINHAIAGKAITISTVGLVPEINRFIDENRRFRLSISLGSAIDEKRARLVPIAARTPVREVMAAARRYALARASRVNLAYVCIQGENIFEEDAKALGDLIGDTPVRLDLIEVTDTSGRYLPPSPDELFQFRDALNRYVRQPIVRRYSGGADINAACGTLAGI